MHPHKKEFNRRQTIIWSAGVPFLLAFAMWLFDDGDISWLELVVADVTPVAHLLIWGSILVACAMFAVIMIGIYWRCPSCDGFLGARSAARRFLHGHPAERHCPHCGEQLH